MSDFLKRIERGIPKLWSALSQQLARNPVIALCLVVAVIVSAPVVLIAAVIAAYQFGEDLA